MEHEQEKLFHEYKGLAGATLNRLFANPRMVARRKGLEDEDLMQIAYEGLWKACITYDKSKKTTFKTHAINHIRWILIEKVKRECNPMKFPADGFKWSEVYTFCSLDAELPGGFDDYHDYYDITPADVDVEDDAKYGLLWNELTKDASEKQIKVMKLRMKGYEYREIGNIFGGLNRETTRHWINPIKKKLKQIHAMN